MKTNHQLQLFEAMKRPGFYPHDVKRVGTRETHISKVFLTGLFAYKIKKPVDLGFLDFTTLEKREHFCHEEVSLNRRLAPSVYIGVVPITCKDGRYALAGEGRTVEYAVQMRELPDEHCMVGLLKDGKLPDRLIQSLAQLLTRFYNQAPTGHEISRFGSWSMIRSNCEENFTQAERFAGRVFDERMFQIIRTATRSFLVRRQGLFARRVETERIRDCHGDLRTGHVYFVDGIQIIDCIEFNNRFRYGDVASDLAFLAMDLDFEGYPDVSQSLLEAYVQSSGDKDIFVLLDFYKSYRAVVRAKVNCFRLEERTLGEEERQKILKNTARYVNLAYRYAVQFTRPTIWVVCGPPASGKSTIAGELGRTLGIRTFGSDRVRKELFGLAPHDQVDVPFGQGIYSKGPTALTYGKLLLLAMEEIESGRSVILDGTYSRRHERAEVIRLAGDVDANLVFIECACQESVLKARLKQREAVASVSDARLHHFDRMKNGFEPLHEVPGEMRITVSTENSLEDSMSEILSQDYILECIQTGEALGARGLNPADDIRSTEG